jgi:signal transduction histidine kinase
MDMPPELNPDVAQAVYALSIACAGKTDRRDLYTIIPSVLVQCLHLTLVELYVPHMVGAQALARAGWSGRLVGENTIRYSVPIVTDEGEELGLLVVHDLPPEQPARAASIAVCAGLVAAMLKGVDRVEQEIGMLRARADEMDTLAQIDRELSDSIQLHDVFEFTLDWAMRYTLAHGAYLSLFDAATGRLRAVASLGYLTPPEKVTALYEMGGIPQRVALTNRLENAPDVSVAAAHVPIDITMRSHLSVPITREDRVIAVISMESRQLNGFTDDHAAFIVKLCARAGIAIDNARLYADAVREREQTRAILSEIADVVIVLGHDGRILLINPSAIHVFRLYTDRRYEGMPFEQVFEDHRLLVLYRRAVTGMTTLTDQITLPGERVYMVNLTPHPSIGWVITLHDLTEVRRADQLKRDFISVLSHDLKQPIGVIQGYLELFEMHVPDMDERAARYIRMMRQALENMSKLIGDMLDLARLDAGIELTLIPVEVLLLFSQVNDWIRPAAEAKGMHIRTEIAPDLPPLRGDLARLTQIMVNLVHNAVKYTPPGGSVVMQAEQQGEMIRLAVRDNGIGISPDDLKAIFNRFFRVRRPETENIEGSGIGLTLVRTLVDLHGGQIGVESRLGEGTTFYVSLPIWKGSP